MSSGDTETVLLLLPAGRNRELLAGHLGDRFAVTTDSEAEAYDLSVLGSSVFGRHRDRVTAAKHADDVFRPCLLLRGSGPTPGDAWSVVDEMIAKPVDPEELDARIENLLTRRRQSARLRDRAARELEAERAFVESAIDAVPDVFYVFGVDGSMRRWNDRLREVTGYDDAEIADMEPLEFVAPEYRATVTTAIGSVLDGEVAMVEAELREADGTTVPYEFNGAPLRDGGGEVVGVVGIGRDITDRRVRQELARQNERLEKFASIVSHDLRNPLSVASGFLGLAREDCDSPDLQRVAEAHDDMKRLIEDLLELARSGAVVGETESVDLGSVVRAAWDGLDTRDATLSVGGLPAVEADPERLQEAVENLFRNAVTHAGEDVAVTVDRLAGADGFYLEDDGPGIPEAARPKVLEGGYTTDEEGTGFGLAIVEEILEAHGWTLRVTDAAGGGARFEVRL